MTGKGKSYLKAKVRSKAGASSELDVIDLSAGGCMVERRAWSALEGERVLVTLPGLASQPGELVWLEEGRAGIAFEQALHEAVLTHLQTMLPAEG